MLPFLCGSIRCGNNNSLKSNAHSLDMLQARQCNLLCPKNVFQNLQESYMVYPSPCYQLLHIPLPIRHRQWAIKPMKWFSMVCCDTYLLRIVLIITKRPAICDLNVMWTLIILLSIISYILSKFSSTHTWPLNAMWCEPNFSGLHLYVMLMWMMYLAQANTVRHCHTHVNSPTAVPTIFIFQHPQFNKYWKAEYNDHTKIAIYLKIEGF